jgi:hypothetical protein
MEAYSEEALKKIVEILFEGKNIMSFLWIQLKGKDGSALKPKTMQQDGVI